MIMSQKVGEALLGEPTSWKPIELGEEEQYNVSQSLLSLAFLYFGNWQKGLDFFSLNDDRHICCHSTGDWSFWSSENLKSDGQLSDAAFDYSDMSAVVSGHTLALVGFGILRYGDFEAGEHMNKRFIAFTDLSRIGHLDVQCHGSKDFLFETLPNAFAK